MSAEASGPVASANLLTPAPQGVGWVSVDGRHLRRDGRPYRVRGMSYGSFAPRPDGARFPQADVIMTDIAAMARCGLNTVRTYSVPPTELLDCAAAHGMQVCIGLH